MSDTEPTTSASASTNVRTFADVPNRLIGYLVDAALLTVLSFVGAIVISIVFGPVVTVDLGGDPQVVVDRGLALANAGLGTVLSAGYFVVSWSRLAGSPGQRMLRMQLSTEDGRGALAPRRGLLRWLFIGLPVAIQGVLAPFVSGTVFVLVSIAVVVWFVLLLTSIARSTTKQGWHDRVAGTVVSKAGRAVPVSAPIDGRPAADVG